MPNIDPNLFATLREATRRYRLRDPSPTNVELAAKLGLQHDLGDHRGYPNCCFYDKGAIVAIRTEPDVISIFHMWERIQNAVEEMADKIE
ncbi:MAG: hypothetical protein KGI78_04330 [Patescibacteria group bacterium]|nr:hypothetical protein [Patescibacteria group bacterium]MDE2058040.1 hypothetical protein [Patescibacteria group bacterium]